MKKNSVAKRKDAEKACEWYCHEHHKCVVTCRSMVTQWNRQDLFASDCIGKRTDGSGVFVQVTAGQATAVSTRRKKLEKIPWHPSDTVELVQLVQTENPANARLTSWFFRVHSYTVPFDPAMAMNWNKRVWKTLETAIPVPKKWFKAFKTEEEKKEAHLKKEKKNEPA